MTSISLLAGRYREQSLALELYVVIEAYHRALRAHEPALFTQGCLSAGLVDLLSSTYPRGSLELQKRDIRYLLAPFTRNQSVAYGRGDFRATIEWVAEYLRAHVSGPDVDNLRICRSQVERLITEVTREITERFSLSDTTANDMEFAASNLYEEVLAFPIDMLQLGLALARLFYSQSVSEQNSVTAQYPDIALGTRVPGASASGRPVVSTRTVSPQKAIFFNCRSYNAYFQVFLPFLFYHEICAHVWADFQPVPEGEMTVTAPSLKGLDAFEEAFVHWTSVKYLKQYLFSDLRAPAPVVSERVAAILSNLRLEVSFGDLRKSFEVYEEYFHNRYERDPKFQRACKTAVGLRANIQVVLGGRSGSDVDTSWEYMRCLVTDLNRLQIPSLEKNELIDLLYYLVAPFGDKFLWFNPDTNQYQEIEVDEALYHFTRQEVKRLLKACQISGQPRLDALLFVRQLRELDRTRGIDKLIQNSLV